MLVQSIVALSLASFSLASALPVTKRTGKAHWWSGLEPYSAYNARYTEIGCPDKHNTDFFEQCCHPRLKDFDLSTIPDECLSKDEQCDDSDDDNDAPSAPVNVAPTPTPEPESSESAPAPTPEPKPSKSAPAPEPKPTKTHSEEPKPTSNPGNGSGSGSGKSTNGSGSGTFFYQNGVAGACGTVHKESDKVVALDYRMYGNTSQKSQFCGKTIHITNKANGKSVDAIVADACPTCNSKGSVDMSVGAFDEIAKQSTGEIDIEWTIDL